MGLEALPRDALLEIAARCERPGALLLAVRGLAAWVDDGVVSRWAAARFGSAAEAARRACALGRERTLLAVLGRTPAGRLGAPCVCVPRI